MINFDEKMKEVKKWLEEKGLLDLQDESFLVHSIKKKNENTVEVEGRIGVYLKPNSTFFSAVVRVELEKA